MKLDLDSITKHKVLLKYMEGSSLTTTGHKLTLKIMQNRKNAIKYKVINENKLY